MTSAVGCSPLPESLSGPCRRLRYHEHNTHKVTKSQKTVTNVRQLGGVALGGHFRQTPALKCKLQLDAKFLHLHQSERSKLASFVQFLFDRINYSAVGLLISLWSIRSTFDQKGMKLRRHHDFSHLISGRRSQRHKMCLCVQQLFFRRRKRDTRWVWRSTECLERDLAKAV